MPKEREVLRALVEVADTFVDDYDVVEFLHRLSERCVELLDCVEAAGAVSVVVVCHVVGSIVVVRAIRTRRRECDRRVPAGEG